jgi:hypothetical protein
MMVATYVERANEIAKLANPTDLITRYPEAVKMLKFLEVKPVAVAGKVLHLHKRHAEEVNGAIERMLAQNAKALRTHTLPRDCLLRLTYDSGGGAVVAVPAPSQATLERQQERWEEETEGAEVYRLWRGDGWWNLVFQGKRDVIEDERGVELIEYLLKNPPDEPIHASELEQLVDGAPLADRATAVDLEGHGGEDDDANGNGHFSIGGQVVERTGKKLMGAAISSPKLKEKVAELKHDMEDDSLPEEEREAAKEEWRGLLQAYSKGGKVGGQAALAVDRVRKAIKPKIDEWKKLERTKGKPNAVVQAFGKHLEECLWLPSMGGKGRAGAYGKAGCFTYVPPDGVIWKD